MQEFNQLQQAPSRSVSDSARLQELIRLDAERRDAIPSFGREVGDAKETLLGLERRTRSALATLDLLAPERVQHLAGASDGCVGHGRGTLPSSGEDLPSRGP